MSVRALDSNHDWTFGAGRNNYVSNNLEVQQSLNTRLNSFLGDCFFDLAAGLNWQGFLSGKDQLGLNLAVSAIILNTPYVQSVNQLYLTLTNFRKITISYNVTTTYSATVASAIQVTI